MSGNKKLIVQNEVPCLEYRYLSEAYLGHLLTALLHVVGSMQATTDYELPM